MCYENPGPRDRINNVCVANAATSMVRRRMVLVINRPEPCGGHPLTPRQVKKNPIIQRRHWDCAHVWVGRRKKRANPHRLGAEPIHTWRGVEMVKKHAR